MLKLSVKALVAGMAALSASVAIAQKPVELRFAVQTPPQVHYNKELFIPWTEKVAADSNKSLTVKMYFAGALGSEGQLVDVVESGAADIALDIAAYYPGRFPLSDVASLPLLVKDGESGSKALWSLYESGKLGDAFKDLKVLAIATPPTATLITTRKKIATPEDLRGLKLAGGGKIKGAVIEAVGAAPVNVKVADLYQSLGRGVVDGAMSFYTAIPPFKLNEVGKHYLDVPLGGSFMIVFMSKKRFDALPEAARQAIDKNSGAAMSAAFGAVWDRAQQVGRSMAIKSGGEITHPDQEQMKAWVSALSPVVDKWSASVKGGKEAVEALRAALEKQAN